MVDYDISSFVKTGLCESDIINILSDFRYFINEQFWYTGNEK